MMGWGRCRAGVVVVAVVVLAVTHLMPLDIP
jgi:hypothetical protein